MRSQSKQHEQETETALIICSMNPEAVARQILSEAEIAGYRLLPNSAETIRDLYFDTPEHTLQRQLLALRIRHVDRHYKLTLKGAGRATDWGAEARLEIEAAWSRDAVTRVIKELAARQIRMPSQISDIDLTRPLDALARLGLEVIQDRVTRRQRRNIVRMDQPGGPALAELAVDHVVYHFGDQRIGLHEVEIEVKREDGAAALRAISGCLAEAYKPALQQWSYSKLATGKAIEKLLQQGSLEDLLDAEHNLKPNAFDIIEDLLRRDVV